PRSRQSTHSPRCHRKMRKDWPVNLDNHLKTLVSADFFVVPTLRFQILYGFLVLAHERRRIVHFAVTAHPTAEWTAQQMREAFPWIRRQGTCCGIAIASLAKTSSTR